FALSFTFFLLNIGITCYMIFLVGIALILDYLKLPQVIVLFMAIPAILMYIDFITLGWLKRNEFIGKLYKPIYRLFAPITLSFLYRNQYYTLLTNIRKWKLLFFGFIFVLISSVFAIRIISKMLFLPTYVHAHNFYNVFSPSLDNLMYFDEIADGDKIYKAAIQSYVVKEDYIKLFVRYSNPIDYDLANKTDWEKLGKDEQIETLSNFFDLTIDEKIASSTENWMFYIHPETRQLGLLNIIPIDNLPPGPHQLAVLWKEEKHLYVNIPFWKE
ncbi:hypothetical protein ACFLU5_18290, partial [Bacteroidota bacterium]